MEDTPELRLGVRCVLLQLFEHNEKAYRAAVQMMEECGKAAIVHPTGTGKSYIAFKLIEEHPDDTIFWLSPSEYIFKTQIENLKRQAPDISLANVHFYTYAKLMCCATEELEAIAGLNPAYIILDEFHRVGAECWGASTLELLKLCPDAKILGLSATNIRYLDNNRDMAEELFDGHIASEMTLGEAIVRGILPAPKYVTTVYQYQKELTRYQNRIDNLRSAGIQDVNQKYLDALRRTLEKADGLDKVFAHHITNKSGKYIVFCANKEHMDEMVSHVPEWFAGVNPDVAVYEAYSDDPGTDRASETYIFKLGEALEQHGHEVQYFGMEHEGRCVGNRVNAYTSDMDFHGGSKLSKLTYPIKTIYSKEARVQLRKVLDDFKPDVCHLNNFNYQLTPSIILEIVRWRKETGRDCKIIFTAHDYQLVCPNHMLNNPNTHQNCEKCLGGHFMNCMKGKCIHGSTAKSAIGMMEAEFWKWKGTYKYIQR